MLPTSVNKFLLLLGCLLFVSLSTIYAQYQIQFWTTDNGLPQNTVYSIAQTPDGYLWMTTLDGVARFDGVRFRVFNKNNTPGIENNRFTKMILDGVGNLWIGTETDFITRYHAGKFQTYRLSIDEQGKGIRNLSLNSQQELLAATHTAIFRWNGESFSEYQTIAGESAHDAILWSRDGSVWYTKGQTLFRAAGDQLREYPLPDVNALTLTNRLLEDTRGRIWIGTQNAGLFFFENEKIHKFSLGESVKDIIPSIEDRDGNIWAGATVIKPDGKVNLITTKQGISEDAVTSTFQDREGNIWIGTTHQGVNRLTPQKVAFYSSADGLATDGVYPIFQDAAGDIWLGGQGLTRCRDGVFSVVQVGEKLSKTITAFTQDRRGRMWFGNWSGAYYLENNQYKNFTGKFGQSVAVFVIQEDENGTMWFGTNKGLYRYQNEQMSVLTVSEGLAGNDVKAILKSADGSLLIGSYGGLTRNRNGALTAFTTNDGLASNLVRSLYEDREGSLWIGSYDGGLTRLRGEKFTRYTSKDGLFNDGVFQILEDENGWFWISCNRGIYRVAKQQLNDFADGRINRIESVAYSKTDGLLETEANGGQQPAGIKARDGKLWFPTQGGVAVIDPAKIKTNPLPPPVVIESLKIDNELFERPKSLIEIAPGKNNLEITYTGLSFIKPEFVKFRYKLEGLDDKWVEAGDRRTAYYSYLPPGEYNFKVIAANADGVWNEEGTGITVRVVPPFYRTWWFWLLCFTAFCAAAFSYYRWRLGRIERARKTQENFSRQLLASQEQERQRIAAELHDSVGQSLLIIKSRVALALNDSDEPEAVREQLEELSESTAAVIQECREISYNLRPYQIAHLGLTKSITAIFRGISKISKIETKIDGDSIDKIFSDEAETSIYRIVQETVNNIIKHSQATGAEFIIKRHGDMVDLLISDNGCGFDNDRVAAIDSRGGGFGLIGMRERARLVGGVCTIEAAEGQGTKIKINIKISPENERN